MVLKLTQSEQLFTSYHSSDQHFQDVESAAISQGPTRRQSIFAAQKSSQSVTIPSKAYIHEPVISRIDDQEVSRSSSATTLTVQDRIGDGEKELESEKNDVVSIQPSARYRYAWLNILRWEWLSVYRRLNLIVVLANVIIISVFAANGALLTLDPGDMSTALAANVTTAVLFRQEYVVNALFLLFGCCPQWMPLWIRRASAKIYHFGGVHSGAGLASIIWLALFDMSLVFHYHHALLSDRDIAIATITTALNVLLLLVVITSSPKFREKFHNIWELVHRFGGWMSVAMFWANFGLLTDAIRLQERPTESILHMLITSPTFWMLIVITVCLILPWLRLRRVAVLAEHQSKYAIRLHFTYTDLPLCAAPRLSTSPLVEWHSFAGIPAENGKGFSVLISGVGDWTKRIVAQPPKYLWTRGKPVRGVLHIAPIFRKVVLVATGSGIGPILSLLYARDVDCRILWATRDPSLTYQPDIIDRVHRADPNAKIIARTRGQPDPDLGKLAYGLHQEIDAEAVFIISNKVGCYKARMYLESRGVLAFSPIFDS